MIMGWKIGKYGSGARTSDIDASIQAHFAHLSSKPTASDLAAFQDQLDNFFRVNNLTETFVGYSTAAAEEDLSPAEAKRQENIMKRVLTTVEKAAKSQPWSACVKEASKKIKIFTGGATPKRRRRRCCDWGMEWMEIMHATAAKAVWAESVGFTCAGTEAEMEKREARPAGQRDPFYSRRRTESHSTEKYKNGEYKNAPAQNQREQKRKREKFEKKERRAEGDGKFQRSERTADRKADCWGCGRTGHVSENCHFKDTHPSFNTAKMKFAETEAGKQAFARGHTALSEHVDAEGTKMSVAVRQAIQNRKAKLTGQPPVIVTE